MCASMERGGETICIQLGGVLNIDSTLTASVFDTLSIGGILRIDI